MKKNTRLERNLFWLAHGPTVTTLAALAIIVVIAGVLSLMARAPRPATPALGTVTGFQRSEGETGTGLFAFVAVEGRQVIIGLPTFPNCHVGDRIALWRQPSWWGVNYGIRGAGCEDKRTASSALESPASKAAAGPAP